MHDIRENFSIFRKQLGSTMKYFRAISAYTIYLFANIKLILLALTSIFFHSILKINQSFDIQIPFTKYIILLIGILGLVNLKFKNFPLFSFCSLFYCFWWFYIMFTFRFANLYTITFIVEGVAMLYLAYRIKQDKGLNEINAFNQPGRKKKYG